MEETKALIDPKDELSSGAEKANALVELVKKAGLSKQFGSSPKPHLFYEAWQDLAKFNHCSIRTLDAEPYILNGIQGAKAKAEVIDDLNGNVVGGAEAYCMRDEQNWANKPFFQLASMAQTRAGSKASRNKWAYIPALAGFATTPAEEMDEVHNDKPVLVKTNAQNAQEGHQNPQPMVGQGGKTPPKEGLITEAQRKRFWAIAKSTKASDQSIKDWLAINYNLHHTTDIGKDIYDEICQRVVDDLSEQGGE